MIHLRIDDEAENSKRRFACGIGPALPDGDKWVYYEHSRMVTCEGCGGHHEYGTPISELSGRPGFPGYQRFCEIAASWGYD